VEKTYGIVKYEWDGFSFCSLDFSELMWDLVCNLLLMEEEIKSSDYLKELSKRTLIMESKLLLWNSGLNNRITLSIKLYIVPLLCMKEW